MTLDRRSFVTFVLGGAAASARPRAARPVSTARLKAVVFDAFPIFDPTPITSLAETLFPGRGSELSSAWRTRQFEYQWLRTLGGQYVDFRQVTEDALLFAASLVQVELVPEKRERLVQAYLGLRAWPDVPSALRSLKAAGLRLAFLSNMTAEMLAAGIENSGLEGLFEHVLSTDSLRTYKPDPRAYQMAVDALGLEREELLFAAFAGWDVAGARWFGYPTFWVNRLALPAEELGAVPDAIGRDLTDLVGFVNTGR